MSLDFVRHVREHVSRILLGKEAAIDDALTTLLAGGHLLIEDTPGVGKTLLARAMARILGLPFQRLQCTADLLPSDVIGANVYDPTTGALSFRPGPVFTSVLVADELNRTPPRTQSALLECMAEHRVSVDRKSHDLPDPFFVVATQNPLSVAGTYPLPENQLDRFLMRISLGYPDSETEVDIVEQEDGHKALRDLDPMADSEDLARARARVDSVRVERDIAAYIVELARRTRHHPDVRVGVSPRGAQALHRAARARATQCARDYVVPDDVRQLAEPVFGHRMSLHGRDASGSALIREFLQETPAPD